MKTKLDRPKPEFSLKLEFKTVSLAKKDLILGNTEFYNEIEQVIQKYKIHKKCKSLEIDFKNV